MTDSGRPKRRIWRSVLALLLGMIVGVVLSLGTDKLLRLAGAFPPFGASLAGFEQALLFAILYRTGYGVLSSYVTALAAPDRPMGHSITGGLIGLALNIAAIIASWNKGPAFGPHWYSVALAVLIPPTAWLGAKLRLMQLRPLRDADARG